MQSALLSYTAGLHDHFNRGRLSIEAFANLSKVIKKKWKKVKRLAGKYAR